MKKLFLLFTFLFSISTFAQIEGTWNGAIELPTVKLPFVLHVTKENNQLKATFDSPDQGGFGIEIPEIRFEENTLYLKHPQMMMTYKGVLQSNNTIKGTFMQGGQSFTLDLTQGEFKRNRPQEPKPKFNYKIEDVTFENKEAKIKLAGTLTTPHGNGKFPTVILVAGSGPNDRDEELFGHKPFLVIADYLTQRGYAVLRYDKRGVASSEGDFAAATVFDFANDTKAAIEYLKSRKEIDSKKIGIWGHSEGGQVAQIVAAQDPLVHFIILMASPAIGGDEILMHQTKVLAENAKLSQSEIDELQDENKAVYSIIKQGKDIASIKKELVTYFKSNKNYKDATDSQINGKAASLATDWMKAFLQFNSQEYLSKINCHVLALNGNKDIQVPATENLASIAAHIGNKDKLLVMAYRDLNHMFQPANTGMPDEYGEIETTIEPKVLEDIINWLNKTVK